MRDRYEELEKLYELKEKGVIDEEEYAEQKKRLLPTPDAEELANFGEAAPEEESRFTIRPPWERGIPVFTVKGFFWLFAWIFGLLFRLSGILFLALLVALLVLLFLFRNAFFLSWLFWFLGG